jgi:exopolysaccharide production protein ExoZ
MQSMSDTPSNQLAAIQVLRGIAAFAVAAAHAIQEVDKLFKRSGGDFPYEHVLPLGAGVDLFFVISGFVMVYASRDLFGAAGSAGVFLRRRLARIVPIYWVVTVIYLVVSASALAPLNRAAPGLTETIASFLFIPYQNAEGLIRPVYSLGWTLNYEMFFYAVFALFLSFRRSVATLLIVAVLVGLAVIGLFVPAENTQLHFWTRTIILEFSAGIIIAQIALSGFKPSRSAAMALIAAALAFFAFGAMLPVATDDNRAFLYGIPGAMLVLASINFNDLNYTGPIARQLVRLGDASYALYIMHPFALRGLMILAGAALTRISPWLYIAFSLTLACVMAYAIWLWFERPVTKALQGSKIR